MKSVAVWAYIASLALGSGIGWVIIGFLADDESKYLLRAAVTLLISVAARLTEFACMMAICRSTTPSPQTQEL